MSFWGELIDRAAPEEHLVQLYGSDDQLLTHNVGRYLAEGLRVGDGLVVIATRDHSDAIMRQLTIGGEDPATASRDGRLVVADAGDTLASFLVAGQPDRALFRRIIGAVLDGARRHSRTGHVRAFGEMVGLLWVAGDRPAALRLEEYWNELLRGSACSLFCAYPIDVFRGDERTSDLEAVLCAH